MQKKIRIAFFGTPNFAAAVLESILTDKFLPVEVTCVITQPDRPVGRKQLITPSPVKTYAKSHGLKVYDSLDTAEIKKELSQTDLVLLYAYGAILKEDVLKLPRWGFWNIHPSLLPKYRGTSPIAYALLMGDKKTGVSLMEMDTKMDHGHIIDQDDYEIGENDTREMLENRLSNIGYKLFKKNVQLLINGMLYKAEQNHQDRTFTRLLTKQDGFIPFAVFIKIVRGANLVDDDCPSIIAEYHTKYGSQSNVDLQLSIYNLFRGLSPWPGVWTLIPMAGVEKRLKITRVELRDKKPVITHVQREGKNEVTLSTFLDAYTL